MTLMQRRRKLLLYLEPRDVLAYKRLVERYSIREGQGSSLVTNRSEFWTPPRPHHETEHRPENWNTFKPKSERYQVAGFTKQKAKRKEKMARILKKRKMGMKI